MAPECPISGQTGLQRLSGHSWDKIAYMGPPGPLKAVGRDRHRCQYSDNTRNGACRRGCRRPGRVSRRRKPGAVSGKVQPHGAGQMTAWGIMQPKSVIHLQALIRLQALIHPPASGPSTAASTAAPTAGCGPASQRTNRLNSKIKNPYIYARNKNHKFIFGKFIWLFKLFRYSEGQKPCSKRPEI